MKKVLLFFSLVFALAAQADVLGEYSFEGTLGDKIPVRLKFAVNGDEIAVGEIYYPKAKNPAPILVVGSPTNDEGWYYLKEVTVLSQERCCSVLWKKKMRIPISQKAPGRIRGQRNRCQ